MDKITRRHGMSVSVRGQEHAWSGRRDVPGSCCGSWRSCEFGLRIQGKLEVVQLCESELRMMSEMRMRKVSDGAQ